MPEIVTCPECGSTDRHVEDVKVREEAEATGRDCGHAWTMTRLPLEEVSEER